MWLGEAFLNIAKVSVCVCMCVWKRGPAYCRHKVYVQTVKQKKLKSFQFRGTETAQPTFQVSSIVSEQNTSVRHQQAQRKRRTGETASPRGDGDRVIRRGELSISQEYSVKTATLIFIFFIHCISYCTLTKTQFLSVIFVSLSSSGWKSRLHISLLLPRVWQKQRWCHFNNRVWSQSSLKDTLRNIFASTSSKFECSATVSLKTEGLWKRSTLGKKKKSSTGSWFVWVKLCKDELVRSASRHRCL